MKKTKLGKFLILPFLAFFFRAFNAFSQDPDFYIFLAFGQSNMEGFAKSEGMDTTVDHRFQVMQAIDCPELNRFKGNFYTAIPPLCRCKTGLTPADYFGRTLIATLPEHKKVGIVNVSLGGCKIELFDKKNYKAHVLSEPDWLQNSVKEYKGNPYGRLVELARLAQKKGVVKGIILHQGESNVGDIEWPDKVKVVYENLIKDLGLSLHEIPLLAGELVSMEQGGKCASMNSIINTLPSKISNAHIISSENCEALPDGLHFSAAGCRKLGRRYGYKMLSIMGYTNVTEE